jgi:hypothetical protein
MAVFKPVKRFETLDDVIREADKKVMMCEAVNCFAYASNSIEVKAKNHRTISLSLCNDCVCKFRDEQ